MVKIVEPEVSLIAETYTSGLDFREMQVDVFSSMAEDLIEFSGRACYQSFHKPNDATRRNADYLRSTILDKQHWSIAEHASATFYITGVSRAFTHELVRHRHLSYSQLSQRFVDESEANIVLPPAFRDDIPLANNIKQIAAHNLSDYAALVKDLEGKGLSRKRAREAARCMLPNMIETRIVVTGNLRAWHQFCERRTKPDADAEMQEVAGMIYDGLNEVSSVLFPDRWE